MSNKEPQQGLMDDAGSFSELDGANVSWFKFLASHARLLLMASVSARKFAEIHFSFVRYVDCPTTMHNTKIRKGNELHTEHLRQLLPADERDLLKQSALFRITSDEGEWFVWAEQAGLSWIPEPDKEYLTDLEGKALWDGGPSLKEA